MNAGPRRSFGRFSTHLVWSGLLHVIQRLTHYKHGDVLEFRISYSVRDLVTDKGRAEAARLCQAAAQPLHKSQ